jgi:ATP-dependent protease ClpP protease subunit
MKQNIFTKFNITFLMFLITIFHAYVQAETNDSHVISGILTTESYENFVKILKSKKISTVTFKDCDGGSLLAAFKIATTIKNNNIKTVASGRVVSACSIAYLGGVTRQIDPTNKENAIQFHGASDMQTGKAVGLAKNQEVLDILYSTINFKFNKPIEEIILNTKSDDEGIIFLRFQGSEKTRDVTLYCPSGVDMKPEKCKKLDGITLESEGIVTK